MKKIVIVVVIIILLVLIIGAVRIVKIKVNKNRMVTNTNVTSCQKLNQSKQTYYLQNDLNQDNCLEIDADYVTLDCNGFKINGNNGVFSSKNSNQIKLKNCEIKSVVTKDINLFMSINTKIKELTTQAKLTSLTHSLVENLNHSNTKGNPQIYSINSNLSSTNISQDKILILPDNNPKNAPGPKRFAIENSHYGITKELIELGDGLSEAVAVKFTFWKAMQPTAPVNGAAKYTKISDFDGWEFNYLNTYESTGRYLSSVISFDHMDWALEYDEEQLVISPETGKRGPGYIRIKPEYEQAWKDFIKNYLSIMPSLKFIQIDNEAENVWVNGEGYARAVKLAREATQEYNKERGSNVKVMAAGFYLTPNIITIPENVKRHMYENHPNIDEEWIISQLDLEELGLKKEDVTSQILKYISQKVHITLSALNQDEPIFDILTIHSDAYNKIEDLDERVNWFRTQMQKNGYEQPIWIDDQHSSYVPKKELFATQKDIELLAGLDSADATIIAQYNKEQSKWLVKKIITHFGAGIERIKIAYGIDIPSYFMPEWKYTGLFTVDLKPKASYYTTKMMVEKLDYFTKATKLSQNYSYKFEFKNKTPIIVAWSETGNKTIDLSRELSTAQVKITYLVNQVDAQYKPIVRPSIISPSNAILLTDEPIFIE